MFFDKRGARTLGARRRRENTRLRPELLESRELLTGVNLDLSTLASKPLGVQETGFSSGAGVGYTVTDVGDVTGSGFDSFVVGSPSVLRAAPGITIGNGTPSGSAYLIFGSKDISRNTIDFALLNAQQRIGDLAFLNNANQTNPANGNPGFTFAGVQITSQSTTSRLGTSVAALGDINGDGINDFMIGAPGASDIQGGNQGTGRAYIIYGSRNLTTAPATGLTLDVDNPSPLLVTNVVRLESNRAGSQLGFSGAGVGDVITDGFRDVAVGAPGATIAGNANAGAVYLISGAALRNPAFGAVLNVDQVGQTGATGFVPGVTFTGTSPGDQAGFSLGGDVNFDGARTSANQSIGDLIIGAPQAGTGTVGRPGTVTGSGRAYLIYGGINLTTLAKLDPSQNILSVRLSVVGDPTVTTGDVPGVVFSGATSGDLLGYSVASAGDFNGDGFGDILLGAPTANSGTGAAFLVQGAAISAQILGNVPLNTIPTAVKVVTFNGQTAGDLVGFSLTAVGDINGDGLNEIALGAPGFNTGYGAVYLIPGSRNLSGVFGLGTATGAALNANVITVPSGASGSVAPAFLGASVSGRITQAGQANTIDGDLLGDLIVGAPGYSLAAVGSNPPTTSRNAAGAVFALEGRFLQLGAAGTGNGTSTSIVTTIGVGKATAPFAIDATTPAALQIFVFSTPTFAPVTDINPSTIVVNGVAFPNATVTADPVDENGDGVPDAIVTITPRSSLGLTNGNNTITITGTTKAAAGALQFTGSASVTVTGATGGGGGGNLPGLAVPPGLQQLTSFPPPNGEHLVPNLDQLKGPAGYQDLPNSVAIAQFLPSRAFINRRLHGIGGTPGGVQFNQNALIVKFGHFSNGRGFAVPKSPYAGPNRYHGSGVLTLHSRVFTHDPAKRSRHHK